MSLHQEQPHSADSRPAAAPLLEQPDGDHRDQEIGQAPDREGSSSWLTFAGFGFLTLNSGMAVHRSQGDLGAVLFVVFSYADLVLLFYCLRRYERAEPDSPERDRLKVAVWLLTTMLTAVFSYKVAAIMPMAVAGLVWALAFATVAGGYYALFYQEKR